MSQFRPTYDRVFSKNKLPDYEYKPPPQQIGVIEGALLKRKSKKWPLKDARWKRYWVVADGTTLRYFRNERSDDDELRKLKPSNGAIARKRVPLQLCSVARTSGGRPGFEVKVDEGSGEIVVDVRAVGSRSQRETAKPTGTSGSATSRL